MRKAWLMCCAIGIAPTAHAQELSFTDAVHSAAADGPTIEARSAAVRAADQSIRPAGALPDPQLVVALDNVPVTGVDRYRFNRDEMTMQRVGIMQEMPSGLHARRARAQAEAERAGASLDVARLDARLGAAHAWISAYFAERRVAVLDRMATEARASANAARARASGGGSLDNAVAAEIEAARLQDRQSDLHASIIAARAELRRWIGEAANEPLTAEAPAFTIDPDHLRHHLSTHPALEAYQAESDVAAADLQIARAARTPDWSWEVSYGRRDPSFGDMVSVEVRVGLPLFQSGRQGPLVDARQDDVARVAAERDAVEREHGAMLEARLAEYAAVSANLARTRDVRLPLAHQRASAATGAFGSGSGSVEQLITARRGALEAELDMLDLEERLAALGAELTLQYGDTP